MRLKAAFSLTFTLTSSDNFNIGGKNNMSDWLDDLIKNKVSKIASDATDQKHQARRSELIDNQLSDLWNHLRALIKQGVERANKTPEIVQKLGGSIYYAANRISNSPKKLIQQFM